MKRCSVACRRRIPGISFSDCLVMEVKDFLRSIRDKVGQDQEIDWQQFDTYLESGDDRFDTLVEQVYLELRRLDFGDSDNIVDVIKCLKSLFSMGSLSSEEWSQVENAFGQAPLGRQVSQSVYDEVIGFYRQYTPDEHVAPYTSVVGPSGIGKSYSVQQLAREYNIYVVYSSLAPQSAGAYPRRTAIANHISQHSLDTLQLFFQCYLLFSLAVVDLCRKVGITPTEHFYLQTRQEYKDFDNWVGVFTERCFEHCYEI